MTAFIHWFAMNGYASYIWSAYGIVCFVLTMNLLSIKRHGVRARKLLRQWEVNSGAILKQHDFSRDPNSPKSS